MVLAELTLSLQALSLGLLAPEVAIPAVANFTRSATMVTLVTETTLSRYEGETAEFLEPFHVARAMEQEGATSEFVSRAQEAILDLAPEDQGKVVVMDEILDNFLFFQGYQVPLATTHHPPSPPAQCGGVGGHSEDHHLLLPGI